MDIPPLKKKKKKTVEKIKRAKKEKLAIAQTMDYDAQTMPGLKNIMFEERGCL